MVRTALIVSLIVIAHHPSARAQTPTPTPSSATPAAPTHSWCRDPHSLPVCAQYLVLEMTGTTRLSGTRTEAPGCLSTCTREALPAWIAWDLGWMRNVSPSRGYGASVQLGGSEEGVRVALKARHRWWLSNRFVVDASAGPLMTQLQGGGSDRGVGETYGATADLGLGVARLAVVTIGADLASQNEKRASALHAGARLESRGVVVGSAVAVIGAVFAAAALRNVRY